MIELSLSYWNKLADQTIFISALLGGFSLAVIVSLLNSQTESRVSTAMIRSATIAAASFLIAIFAMTKIMMMTTPGFPSEVTADSLTMPRILGMLTFVSGITSLIVVVSLAGWTKSKRIGRFTTTVGIITFVLIVMMLV